MTRIKVVECFCRIQGMDDGDITCWTHHDCNNGTCTHVEEEENAGN